MPLFEAMFEVRKAKEVRRGRRTTWQWGDWQRVKLAIVVDTHWEAMHIAKEHAKSEGWKSWRLLQVIEA